MRKLSLFSVFAMTLLAFSSCDKVEKLLFQPFESPLSFDVTIDAVSNTNSQVVLGSQNVAYNLNQEIKDATDDKFDASIVGAMYINEVAITLLNADGQNNLSNFESVSLAVSSGNATPVVFGPFNVPAGATNTANFTVANSPNIKQFFSGSQVRFELRGKAKTATTKALNAEVGATIKFDK